MNYMMSVIYTTISEKQNDILQLQFTIQYHKENGVTPKTADGFFITGWPPYLIYTVPTIKRSSNLIMTLKLYKMDVSPPARAAMMACDVLNLSLEMIDVNLLQKDHLKPEYLEKNPVHTVPVLEHGDLVIADSHAILMYLFDVYGNDDKYYPKDVKKRAVVNQRLFFDTAILFPRLRNISYPAILEGVRTVTEKQLKAIDEAYSFVEEYLSKSRYIAGDDITIADISAYANVTSLIIILPLDSKKYPKTQSWMNDMKNQPFSQKYNAPGIAIFEDILKRSLDL